MNDFKKLLAGNIAGMIVIYFVMLWVGSICFPAVFFPAFVHNTLILFLLFLPLAVFHAWHESRKNKEPKMEPIFV